MELTARELLAITNALSVCDTEILGGVGWNSDKWTIAEHDAFVHKVSAAFVDAFNKEHNYGQKLS